MMRISTAMAGLLMLSDGILRVNPGEAAALPKTLLEYRNVTAPTVSWSESVLIIIDAQREYETGRLPLSGIHQSAAVIAKLLHAARTHGAPIIHVMQLGKPGGLFDPSTDNAHSLTEAAALPGEVIVQKTLPDSFEGTELKSILDKIGRNKLVIAGYMTHMCVSSTVHTAFNFGYTNFVVRDAVATRDLRSGSNDKVISASEINESQLASLKDRFAWIIDSEDILR